MVVISAAGGLSRGPCERGGARLRDEPREIDRFRVGTELAAIVALAAAFPARGFP